MIFIARREVFSPSTVKNNVTFVSPVGVDQIPATHFPHGPDRHAGGNSFLEALWVALQNSVRDGRSWFVSILQLQQASMQVCRVVRGTIGFHLKVDERTPRIVWDGVVKEMHELADLAELPALRVRGIKWEDLHRSLRDMVWPDYLLELSLGDYITQSLETVMWPSSLKQLTLGYNFDHPVEGVSWPSSLLKLTFGCRFNRPIGAVSWPLSLRQLEFGSSFNRPIEGVA